jgi:ABC-type Fe3+ transport system substrate-binding protein
MQGSREKRETKMKMHDQAITRRSTLGLVGLGGASSLLLDGLLHDGHAQAASTNKTIQQAAAKEGALTLLLQTNVSTETIGAMIQKFNAHYPAVHVSFNIQNTAQVMNRFTAEVTAKRGVSDCVVLPSVLTETDNYIATNAIAKYVSSQDAAFPNDAKRSGLWYAWTRECAVTVYRQGSLSDDEKKLLRTYRGLGDARFKGRLGINGITNSVAATAAYVLLNQPDESLWQGLVANAPRVKTSTPALINGLLAGEYDVALFAAWGSTTTPARAGAPIEFGNTALTPVLYVPGGISALAPHPNAARLWQDWILSREGQNMWATAVGSNSARQDVVKPWPRQQPWFFESPGTHKPIDWADFSKKEKQVLAQFKKDFQAS